MNKFEYLNSNIDKYPGRLSNLFLWNSIQQHFWNQKKNSCDMEQLDLKLFEISQFSAHLIFKMADTTGYCFTKH